MIGNLSGLKAVVFLWRFGPLLRDARAICGTRLPRVNSLGETTTNDIAKIRKPQTRLKRTQVCPPIAQKRRGQPYVEVSELYFYIYSLF